MIVENVKRKFNNIVIIMFVITFVKCRELGTKCREEIDWINQLVMQRVEEETFSVEPVLGVGVPPKPSLDSTIEEVVKLIREANDTISAWTIRECLGRYLKATSSWKPYLIEGPGESGLLGYEKPHYLGPIEPFPIPVPDDEEYRPGPEGYTTYINPYNFMNKVPEYKPRPRPTDEDYDYYFDSQEESSAATTTARPPSPDDEETHPNDNGLGLPGESDKPVKPISTSTTKRPSIDNYDYNYYDSSYDDYYD